MYFSKPWRRISMQEWSSRKCNRIHSWPLKIRRRAAKSGHLPPIIPESVKSKESKNCNLDTFSNLVDGESKHCPTPKASSNYCSLIKFFRWKWRILWIPPFAAASLCKSTHKTQQAIPTLGSLPEHPSRLDDSWALFTAARIIFVLSSCGMKHSCT